MSEEERKAIEKSIYELEDSYELHQREWAKRCLNTLKTGFENQRKEIEHLKNLNKFQSKDITKAVDYTFELNNEIEKERQAVMDKLKEIKYDLDFEPWSIYKVNGDILFEILTILEGEKK